LAWIPAPSFHSQAVTAQDAFMRGKITLPDGVDPTELVALGLPNGDVGFKLSTVPSYAVQVRGMDEQATVEEFVKQLEFDQGADGRALVEPLRMDRNALLKFKYSRDVRTHKCIGLSHRGG